MFKLGLAKSLGMGLVSKLITISTPLALKSQMFLSEYTKFMEKGINGLKFVVIAIGGGLLVLGVIDLLEGYGNDNPGAKSQGMKRFISGAGIMVIGALLVPELKTLVQNWKLD